MPALCRVELEVPGAPVRQPGQRIGAGVGGQLLALGGDDLEQDEGAPEDERVHHDGERGQDPDAGGAVGADAERDEDGEGY